MRGLSCVCYLAAVCWLAAPAARADDDNERRREVRAFQAELVKVGEVGSTQMTPAVFGRVEVLPNRMVEVQVRDLTPAPATLNVFFCRAAAGLPPAAGACNLLGQLSTNVSGNGEALFQFPGSESVLAGNFALMRMGGATTELIGGFRLLPPQLVPVACVGEVELRGRVASVDANAAMFRLQADSQMVDVFIDLALTRFERVSGLAALPGMQVEVRGCIRDGRIVATRVKADGDGQGQRGRDDDDDDHGHGGPGKHD